MLVYIILLLISFISLCIYQKQRNKFFAITPYIAMALVCGLRYEVGRDYISYVNYFYYIVNDFNFDVEIGYKLIVKLVSLIGGTQQLIFLIMSMATCYFYYKFLIENSENFMLSTILYLCLGPFYFSSFNAIRQALAVAIFLYAVKYLNINIKKYLVLVIFAGVFHYSTLVFLLFPIAKKLKPRYVLYFVLTSILLTSLIESGILMEIIDIFTEGYLIYSRLEVEMDISYLLFLVVNIFVLFFYKQIGFKEKDHVFLLLLVVSSTLIFTALTTQKLTVLLERFIYFVSPLFLIVAVKFNNLVKPRGLINGAICIFAVIYYFFNISTSIDMLPYNFNFLLFKF